MINQNKPYGGNSDRRTFNSAKKQDRPVNKDRKSNFDQDKPNKKHDRPFDNRSGYHKPAFKDDFQDTQDQEPEEEDESLLIGRHAIREALRSGRSINKLLYANGNIDASAREIIADAKKLGIVTQAVDKTKLDSLSMNGKHQSMIAYAAAYQYSAVADILAEAVRRNEAPFVIVLDGINDPHNLGSIIRSAVCAGAHGVIIPKRRAVGLTGAVSKTSAGAIEFIPVARVTNINNALEELKKAGLWISGASTDGASLYKADFKGPTALVIGNEGEGISRLTLDHCDFKVKIPQTGRIDSLNASVAAAVIMYEVVRQRSIGE